MKKEVRRPIRSLYDADGTKLAIKFVGKQGDGTNRYSVNSLTNPSLSAYVTDNDIKFGAKNISKRQLINEPKSNKEILETVESRKKKKAVSKSVNKKGKGKSSGASRREKLLKALNK